MPGMAEKKRRAATSGSYSITVRLFTEVDPAIVGQVATAISEHAATLLRDEEALSLPLAPGTDRVVVVGAG